jgi:hypothetical protein
LDELDPPPPPLPPPPLPPPPLPPPPPEELLDDELPEDDDEDGREELDDELDDGELDVELDDDELEGALLLELEDDPLVSGDDDVLEPPDPPSGPVGDVPHPTPSMPTPARATPPDSILRNCRRSSRRVASSTGCGFSDWLMRPPSRRSVEQWVCQAKDGQSGGSAPPS